MTKKRKDWLLRLPEDLHTRVEALAKRDRRSLNGTYAMLIERGLNGGSGYTIEMKFDRCRRGDAWASRS